VLGTGELQCGHAIMLLTSASGLTSGRGNTVPQPRQNL
jgi:hypothetical protein